MKKLSKKILKLSIMQYRPQYYLMTAPSVMSYLRTHGCTQWRPVVSWFLRDTDHMSRRWGWLGTFR